MAIITTLEELAALPERTVAMFTFDGLSNPVPFESNQPRYWQQPGDAAMYPATTMARHLPATVIYRPAGDREAGK